MLRELRVTRTDYKQTQIQWEVMKVENCKTVFYLCENLVYLWQRNSRWQFYKRYFMSQ